MLFKEATGVSDECPNIWSNSWDSTLFIIHVCPFRNIEGKGESLLRKGDALFLLDSQILFQAPHIKIACCNISSKTLAETLKNISAENIQSIGVEKKQRILKQQHETNS